MSSNNNTSARLNKDFHYARGKSFTDLLDVHTYNQQGRYFHTVDGRFAKVWLLGSYSVDTMSEEMRVSIANGLAQVINQFPQGSSGQLIRYCHGDIHPTLDRYLDDSQAVGFGEDIVKAIVRRQIEGATTGFFNQVGQSDLNEAKQDILDGGDLTQEDREKLIQNVERSMLTGQYALQIENLLVFLYTPYWLRFGYMVEQKGKKLLATLGLYEIEKEYKALYRKETERFLNVATRIEQTASNFGFAPGSINAQMLINIIYREINPKRARSVPPPEYTPGYTIREHLELGRMTEVPDVAAHTTFSTLTTNNSGWEIDGVHYKVVSAKVLPKRIHSGKMYDVMESIDGEYWTVMNFSVPSQAVVRNMLRIRRTAATGNSTMATSPFLKGDEILKQEKLRDIAITVSATNLENQDVQIAIDATLHVIVKNEDEKKALATAQKVADDMWAGGVVEKNRGDAVIHQCLPLNYRLAGQKMLQRELRMLAVNYADLAPTLTAYSGYGSDTSGMLVNNSNGAPIFIDIFSTRAAHTLIQGGTGSGKSFLFNSLLMQQKKFNPKVFIVDKGRSYESLCEATGGSYVELVVDAVGDIKPTCLNPFYVTPGKKPTQEDIEFMRDVLVAMVLCGGRNEDITKTDANLLLTSITEVFSRNVNCKEITLGDIHSYLMSEQAVNEKGEGRALAKRFVEFTRGQIYGKLFDGPLGVNWDADMIVFETERMATSKAMPVVMLALFQQINVYCKWVLPIDRRKIVAVDEAWATLSQPESAAAIAGFFREMRKYKCGVVLLSQTLADFSTLVSAATKGSGGSSGGGILENTMHFFLLASSPGDHQTGRQILSLTNEEVGSWSTVASLPPYYSECFYRMRDDRDVYLSGKIRIYSNPLMLWTASSTPEDRQLRNKTMKEYQETMDPSVARRKAINDLSSKYPLGYRHHLRSHKNKTG